MTAAARQPRRTIIDRSLDSAEGYLHLVTGRASRFGVARRFRNRMARHCVDTAVQTLRDHRPTMTRSQRIRSHLLIGQGLRVLRRFDSSVKHLWFVAQRDPADRDAWLALGWSLKRLGRVAHAASILEMAIRFRPDDAMILYNLACYQTLLGEHDAAIENLCAALDRNSDLLIRVPNEADFDGLRHLPQMRAIAHASLVAG